MKNLKISKELISEILGRSILNFTVNVGFIFIQEKTISHSLNTYEFAFKCKEWISNKGYSQLSGKDDIYEKGMGFVCSIGSTTLLIEDFYADTEVEAIIKACTHILNNLSNK